MAHLPLITVTYYGIVQSIKHVLLFMLLLLLCSKVVEALESVDIGVFFTADVIEHESEQAVYAQIVNRTKIANQALSQSNVNLQRTIVAFEPISLFRDPDANLRQFLTKVQSSVIIKDHIERFGLDYVTVLTTATEQGDSCGFAEVGGKISVVAIGGKCDQPQKDYLLAHEWGHLDGASHDVGDGGKKAFGFGYVCDGRSTIMSMTQPNEYKYLFYSSSQACGKAGVADVARMITERMRETGAIQNTHAKMTILGTVGLLWDSTFWNGKNRHLTGKVRLDQPIDRMVSVQIYTEKVNTVDNQTDKTVPLTMQRLYIPAGQIEVPFVVDIKAALALEPTATLRLGLRYPEQLAITSEPVVISGGNG